jgi:ferritin-like metal-binding protein YciE
MDARTDAAVAQVRAKRTAIDNRLELLRVRMQQARPDPEPARQAAIRALPVVALAAAVWLWRRIRRRRVRTMPDLLVHSVAALYAGGIETMRALRRMSRRAEATELRIALARHAAETEDQLERLERVFRAIGERRPRRRLPPGIVGLLIEVDAAAGGRVHRHVRDASLVTVAQRLAHYRIAAYGAARAQANALGYVQAGQLLQQGQDEERAHDESLATLASRFVNYQALRRRGTRRLA